MTLFDEWLSVSVANIYSVVPEEQERDPTCADAGFAFAFLTTCELVSTRTMPKLRGLIFAATAILVSPVYAETCPGPITKASRLVLVTTRSMDTELATLPLFTRPSAKKPWKRMSAAEPLSSAKLALAGATPSLTSRRARNRRRLKATTGHQEASFV